jgi:predicted O-linked N-acetylglucosamine transferase (SPINDLY family)
MNQKPDATSSAEQKAKTLFFAAADRFDAGDYGQAERHYREVLTLVPERSSVLGNLAGAILRQGRPEEALTFTRRAIALDPQNADVLHVAVAAELALGRLPQALASFDRLVERLPGDAEVWSGRGDVLAAMAQWDEALASYDRALAVRPAYVEALNNRGNILRVLGRREAALASYDKALAAKPDYADALCNRGVVLYDLHRPQEALANYDHALAVRPDHAEALCNRGVALNELNRPEEALVSIDRALAVKPNYVEALCNRGNALKDLNRADEALASYDSALALRPDYVEALANRGNILKEMGRLEEALGSYDRVLAARPGDPNAVSGAADAVIRLCDWTRRDQFARQLADLASRPETPVTPFLLLQYGAPPAVQLQNARNHVAREFPALPRPLWNGETWRNEKVRIAYLSVDFRDHAIAHLTAGLFEHHDRLRFETIGVSFGIDDHSPVRRRIVASFDKFHDVRTRSDDDVARLLHDLRVDVAIDLSGYTQHARPRILAHRPAPIQVSYIGFPGTMGASFIDYIMADAIVIPLEEQRFYSEKVVRLPGSYLVNDSRRRIAERTPTRREMGLPETGFVFCCFNNTWKIAPDLFDVWMRLLQQIDGSVLWLLRDNPAAEANLRIEAEKRAIDPSRLIFADRLPVEQHLARHRLADLFLDTLPYNAHTTACDALWAGLPVLTVAGAAFVGRVAASVLRAVGLRDLIADNLEDYATRALRIARTPTFLASIKARLAGNRNASALFDTESTCRAIETAYTTMWEVWQNGDNPRSFTVQPAPGGPIGFA